MICARRFTPPLAVGIFGNWGTGKSFFMRLLHDRIEALAKPGADPARKPDDFHGNVAQIRFNAWHYVETNLWASIVNHIFTCLDQLAERKESPQVAEQLFDQLDTARELMIEAARELMRSREERALAIDALAKAQHELARAHSEARSSVSTIVSEAWAEFATPEAKSAINSAVKELGLGDAVASAGELQAALAEICDAVHERQIVRAARWSWLGRGTTVGLFVGLTLAAPLAFEWVASKIGVALAPLTAVVASLAATASGALALANRAVSSAANRLRAFSKRLDASIARRTADKQSETALAETKVARAVATEAEAERRLHVVNERTDAAAQAFNAHNSRSHVLHFVRERIAQGDYARQLGFTATVRKDFEELSRLMVIDNAPDTAQTTAAELARLAYATQVTGLINEAKKNKLLDENEVKTLKKTTEPPPAAVGRIVERIVLYIDDLDRCPPEQVVAVLQAVHLLLAFPLFVVFVAVDVRWASDALVQQYSWRMKGIGEGTKTSPMDYLEKIFQIPYWVRPIGVDGVRGILKDRFGEARDYDLDATRAAAPQIWAFTAQASPATAEHQQAIPSSPPVAIEGPTSPPKAADPRKLLSMPRRTSTMRLTQAELVAIDALASILGDSPRRTLRFVNVYKIIKTSLSDDEIETFDARGYVAATTCLAVNIALPERYARFVDAALALPDDCSSPYDSLAAALPELHGERFRVLETLLRTGDGGIGDLRHYAELIERYSFQPRSLPDAGSTR